MIVTLPFPPSALSGHGNGHWRTKARIVATWRAEAFHLTRNARLATGYTAPETGDIALSFTFHAPDNRGDRTNYPNRLKPQIDGIAEALGVNDRRFLPSYTFGENRKPGCVIVHIGAEQSANVSLPNGKHSGIKCGPETLRQQRPALTDSESEVRNG